MSLADRNHACSFQPIRYIASEPQKVLKANHCDETVISDIWVDYGIISQRYFHGETWKRSMTTKHMGGPALTPCSGGT